MASRGQLMQRACGHTRMLAAEREPEGPEQSEQHGKAAGGEVCEQQGWIARRLAAWAPGLSLILTEGRVEPQSSKGRTASDVKT